MPFLAEFANRLRGPRVRSDARRRIAERNRQYPTCFLANTCRLEATELGRHVSVHDRVVLLRTRVRNHTYLAPGGCFQSTDVGSYCSIGQDVAIGLSKHPARDFIATYPAFYAQRNEGCRETFVTEDLFDETPDPTEIGNDVWIGNRAIVPGGITIADGAIVAASSVVTKDVEPFAIVGGNPAKFIRFRFPEEEREFLLATAWWDWPEEEVRRHARIFSDFERFRKVVSESDLQRKTLG